MAKTALLKVDAKGALKVKVVEGDYLQHAKEEAGNYIVLPVLEISADEVKAAKELKKQNGN